MMGSESGGTHGTTSSIPCLASTQRKTFQSLPVALWVLLLKVAGRWCQLSNLLRFSAQTTPDHQEKNNTHAHSHTHLGNLGE